MGKHGNQCVDDHEQAKSQKPTKQKKKPMKITYISSPTMVKATNPSEFRAIVQELTGKDSKVVGDYCDGCTYSNEEAGHDIKSSFPSYVELGYDNSYTNVNHDGSVSLEIDEAGNLLWKDVSESFLGYQSTNFVFV